MAVRVCSICLFAVLGCFGVHVLVLLGFRLLFIVKANIPWFFLHFFIVCLASMRCFKLHVPAHKNACCVEVVLSVRMCSFTFLLMLFAFPFSMGVFGVISNIC